MAAKPKVVIDAKGRRRSPTGKFLPKPAPPDYTKEARPCHASNVLIPVKTALTELSDAHDKLAAEVAELSSSVDRLRAGMGVMATGAAQLHADMCKKAESLGGYAADMFSALRKELMESALAMCDDIDRRLDKVMERHEADVACIKELLSVETVQSEVSRFVKRSDELQRSLDGRMESFMKESAAEAAQLRLDVGKKLAMIREEQNKAIRSAYEHAAEASAQRVARWAAEVAKARKVELPRGPKVPPANRRPAPSAKVEGCSAQA